MARAQGARSQLALAFESVYGTAPASGYTKMPFASETLSSEQPLIDNELLGYGRDPLAPIRGAVTADGDIVVPVDVDGIGFWLKAAFGAAVVTGTTPKTHTFKSGGVAIPSMAIEVGNPEVPNFSMFAGVVLDKLAFQMARTGNLQATASLVAQGETPSTTAQSGTLAALAQLKRFGHFNGAIKRNGVALGNIVSGDFAYSNNLDRVETIRADGKIDGADPTIAAMTGSIVARFADTTLRDQAIAGTSCALEFSWVISANESLTFTVHEVYLPVPRREITGPQGIQATFNWQAALNSAAGCMVTAVLKNAVASY
jgi:hypothetical protein